MSFKFIDLFAGIGGIRLGFESVGGDCVFSSEIDSFSRTTYKTNFGHEPDGDIHSVDIQKIPDHDLLAAGFPCQPFSLAGVSKKQSLGRQHGFLDKTQGTLFFKIAEILAAKRPSVVFLENVKNLKSHDKGNTFRVILETLEELNYSIFYSILDGRHFVPQHRERVYIVCLNKDRFDSEFVFPTLPDSNPTLKSILEKNVPEKYTISDHLWTWHQNYALKHKAKGNGFGFGLVNPGSVTRTLSARYYKDGSEILIDQKDKSPRRLTPRECARLMGFPDSFQIPVSDTQAYKQFGNSVVVPVIQFLANSLRPFLQSAVKSRKSA